MFEKISKEEIGPGFDNVVSKFFLGRAQYSGQPRYVPSVQSPQGAECFLWGFQGEHLKYSNFCYNSLYHVYDVHVFKLWIEKSSKVST